MQPLNSEMIEHIEYGDEERRWEFKPPMIWGCGKNKRKFEIVKTIMSFSNTAGGGYIIIGITQPRNRANGIKFIKNGLRNDQFNTFENDDDIGRFINSKSSQIIEFKIYGGSVKIENNDKKFVEKKFVVIRVFENKSANPIICTYDFKTPDRKCRINEGALYIRTNSYPVESRIIKSPEEWDELIRRSLSKKEEIIYKDLKSLCKNVNFTTNKKTSLKQTRKKSSSDYDKYLKRDKL